MTLVEKARKLYALLKNRPHGMIDWRAADAVDAADVRAVVAASDGHLEIDKSGVVRRKSHDL